ncbi:MAG: 50S ribosomal protein L4 [Firmicutes bacterium]|nr:50S ribosomal protein L4 [Bacillota bacterium]
MPTVPVYNLEGQRTGEIELSEEVFGAPINRALLHEAVRLQLASRRLGTAKAKTRAEVRGGGRKPWRQKGTGQARHGSRRSPLWTGGGVVFPPVPRKYGFSLPRKARRYALRSALSAKVAGGEVLVVEGLHFEAPKTKAMVALLGRLNLPSKTLIVLPAPEENVEKSARNIPGLTTLLPEQLNVYDILNHDRLLLAKEAVGRVEEALA